VDLAELPALSDYSMRTHASSLGRTYMYFRDRVQYPFGYDLSYTRFSYSGLAVERLEVDANDTLTLHAQITNTGDSSGADVVQLYVSTPDAAPELERPLKRLCAFRKLTLAPGETRGVDFTLAASELAFFDGHASIQPGLTVAFSDDTLYDYSNAAQRSPLPAQLNVELSSHRPEIVFVDAQGELRSGGVLGVATITAGVAAGAARAATEFVIYVR